MVEVSSDEWNVDVARFADGLAVVHGLEHGKQARVLLNQPSKCVQVTRATVPAERSPDIKYLVCCGNSGVDVVLVALRNARKRLGCGRIDRLEIFTTVWLAPLAIDEMTECARVLFQPAQRGCRTFGC